MRDISGIINLVAVFDDRLLLFQMAQYPKFLKPADVPDLPERRIDDSDARADELFVVETSDEIERASAEFAHDRNQVAGTHGGKYAAVRCRGGLRDTHNNFYVTLRDRSSKV